MRVRGFTQDDAHIFCTAGADRRRGQSACLEFAVDTLLDTFGFERIQGGTLHLGSRGHLGKYRWRVALEQWELADKALRNACGPAEGMDALACARRGRVLRAEDRRQAGGRHRANLAALDNPVRFQRCRGRFGLEYIAEDGKAHQPLMVHRALFGSLERFFGILIEHYAGAFPVWLAPVQATVLPITDRHLEYAKQVKQKLAAAGVRVQLDDRNEKVNLKIREAQLQKIPFMLVVGDREKEDGTVAVRNRKHGDQGVKSVDDFLAEIKQLDESKTPSE